MVWGDERWGEEDSLIVRISINLLEYAQSPIHLFFLGAGQEKDVTLHAVDVYSRSNLDVRISYSCSFQVLFAVVLTRVELNLLDGLISIYLTILSKVVVAWNEVVEFLQIFKSHLDSWRSPDVK